ncbi:MAG: trimethylamine methyltransferase family protein [Chloroflexi bacterium]|nr:trimethylamine methyltransferase family protein [Chloroflexota bacterium]
MTTRKRKRNRQRERHNRSPLLDLPFRQVVNPVPPLDWASPAEVEKLHDASMHILENIGLDFFDDEALDILEKAGAKVDRKARHAWLDRGLVLEAVAKAPSLITWQARNPAHTVTIGGNRIIFVPNSGMPYVSTLDSGRRPGTMADLKNFSKLAQVSAPLHSAGGTHVEPQDVPASLRHLHRLQANIELTDKPLREFGHGRIITGDNLQMMRIAFGGSLPDNPVISSVINVNSPLRFDDRMLGGLITLARAGQIVIITPFIMAGAMSPVTMAAALAQQNAEALAGITLAQLVKPGAPAIYGGFTMNVDMQSGSPAFGSPEGAWAILVGAQMARRYNLPYRASGSLTNAKVPDAQAAYETMWTLWPTIQAHTNFVHHAVGWLDGGLTASYEKFIIDLELLAMFIHFLEGFAINDDTLALDMIAAVGPGGHHFGTPHTQARFKTAFYQPFVTDRQGYEPWLAAGGEDAMQRAHKIWKQLLKAYEPPPLDPGIEEELADFVARREKELDGTDLYG